MKRLKKSCKKTFAIILCLSMFVPNVFLITAKAQQPSDTNLALNKPVTASAEYSTMPASKLTDGDEDSRWSSESGPVQWAYVDLGQSMKMDYFSMIWESASVHASEYNIYVSDDPQNWGTPVVAKTGNAVLKSEDRLSSKVSGQYVKLEVTKMSGYPSVSCRDFTIKYTNGISAQDPLENVALGKNAQASSIEAGTLGAEKAFDGDTSSKSSRWSSAVGSGPHWIYVDLGEKLDVKTIRLFWETRKATAYKIQIADTISSPTLDADWTDVKTFSTNPAVKDETISLDNTEKARYVRLYIDSITPIDPDSGVSWNTISLYEIEIYGGEPKENISDIAEKISVVQPNKGDTQLQVQYPTSADFDINYNGTDYKYVIDEDLTIYPPVVDTTVKVSFKLVNKQTQAYIFKEIDVTVPGTHTQTASDNKSPAVLPEIREWKGMTGDFTPSTSSKILIAEEKLRDMAEVFAKDYQEITGNSIDVSVGSSPSVGDFYFSLTTDTSKGLKDEGYIMNVDSSVNVEAETTTGAFWATRTILQSLKSTNSIPNGIARDYPMYEVRSFILDVGRKTFTMEYMENVVKLMSWYKMNDFQVHLNDNFIFLENYDAKGWDPMQAYSGFRLESDIKEGGNGGLNKADLTSKDVFYTKDEFRNFINESRVYGVNIVPEIDTPAHSLALTKVRPDLRHGTSGRNNDHLNLLGKYSESVAFVKEIFDEYMGSGLSNPVFDKETIIHVGADEYNADKEAFRRFSDDMLEYVQNTGRTARIWGSLSQAVGTTPVRSKDVQMNLWNFGYANMDKMYEDGFDLINCNDGDYYIVPNAGYYYDYLSNDKLYNLPINKISNVTIPAGDKQMIGGAIAVWNDMVDYLDPGITEYDVYDRIKTAIPLFGAKLWGKGEMNLTEAVTMADSMGKAPNTDFEYEVKSQGADIANYPMDNLADNSANNYDLTLGKNAEIKDVDGKKALYLEGGESYVNTPIDTVGLGNNLRVKVKRTSDSKDEQVLFESSYGKIKAVQIETGKVGFSRENMDFSFDYELPLNEWVELEFKNVFTKTHLYVNGVLVDTLGDGERVENRPLVATTMLPFGKIGSSENAFVGYVDDIRIGEDDNYNSTMELDYLVLTAKILLKENSNSNFANLVSQAEVIFTQFAPDSTEIQSLVTKINQIIDAISFKKADYSRVNAYLDLVPSDLSVFTNESVNKLQRVIDSIREDLPAELQNIVDEYENQLANAIHSLEVKDGGNVNYIPNSRLTVQASSYQDNDAHPNHVLDDVPGNLWHSKWSITTMPHWIELIVDSPEAVDALVYIPRQTGGQNGMLKKYEVQVSDDGVSYTKVAEGTLKIDTRDEQVISFSKVTAKYFRLVYLEAHNNNATATGLKLSLANVAADITGLNKLIDDAEKVQNAGYTQESWDALQEQIKEAKQLVSSNNPLPNDVELMKRELSSKIIGLTLKAKLKTTELENLIKEAKAVDVSKYTDETVKALNVALDEAENIDLQNATQDIIDSASKKLRQAMDSLAAKIIVDTGALEELLKNAEKTEFDKYTDNSVLALKTVIAEVKALLNGAPTQAEVSSMISKLQNALTDLEIKNIGTALSTEKLEALIKNSKEIDKSKYTAESIENLEKALVNASDVIKTAKKQSEIDAAYSNLLDAVSKLELINIAPTPKPTASPAPTSDPTKPTAKPTATPATGNNKPAPTADNFNIFLIVICFVISSSILCVIINKNKVKNKN